MTATVQYYLVFIGYFLNSVAAQFGGLPGLGLGVPGMHGGLSTMGAMGQPRGAGMPFGGPMGGSPGTIGGKLFQ